MTATRVATTEALALPITGQGHLMSTTGDKPVYVDTASRAHPSGTADRCPEEEGTEYGGRLDPPSRPASSAAHEEVPARRISHATK